MKTIDYKGFDLSKITVFDLSKKFPDFAPLIISPDKEIEDEKFRVLSLLVYAVNYQIRDLCQILEKEFKSIYPDLFNQNFDF